MCPIKLSFHDIVGYFHYFDGGLKYTFTVCFYTSYACFFVGAQLKTMHNIRLVSADVLDLCKHKPNRVG